MTFVVIGELYAFRRAEGTVSTHSISLCIHIETHLIWIVQSEAKGRKEWFKTRQLLLEVTWPWP